MFSIPWLSVLQDRFQSCVRKNNRRRQLQKHSSHTPHIARAVSMHAAESLEERMLLTVFTVVNTNDSGEGSLRAAIEVANAEAGADEITFADTLAGQTIKLTDELLITDAVTITGLGANQLTIDANGNSRIFQINSRSDTHQPLNPPLIDVRDLTVSDAGLYQPFDVEISGLTLRNGSANQGGAIFSYDNLTLSGMYFTDNLASGNGGAVTALGDFLKVTDSYFEQNQAGGSGGGIYSSTIVVTIGNSSFIENQAGVNGGGIYTRHENSDNQVARIRDSLFAANKAKSGGGIYSTSYPNNGPVSELSIYNSELKQNEALNDGGGIYHQNTSLTIYDSTLAENQATRGGAIDCYSGQLSLNGSTISNNAASGDGGGIAFLGSVRMRNSTLSGNQAQGAGGGIFGRELYVCSSLPWQYTCGNSVLTDLPQLSITEDAAVAESVNPVIVDELLDPLPLVDPTENAPTSTLTLADVEDLSISDVMFVMRFINSNIMIWNSTITGNFAEETGGGLALMSNFTAKIENTIVAGNSSTGNRQIYGNYEGDHNIVLNSVAGLLDPVLRDNGGSTLTHALLAGSAAINAGSNARVQSSIDQRGWGYQRIYDGTVDIGAVEWNGLSLVVDTLSDSDDGDYSSGQLSLLEAIRLSESTVDPSLITFSNALAGGTIALQSELLISSSVTIVGLGQGQLTIDGGDQSRIFRVDDGNNSTAIDVEISGLSLIHGSADRGGAILNYEDLSLSNSTISENLASADGGGIYHARGQLTVSDSYFADNVAQNNGGGIFNNVQDLLVNNTTFFGNNASRYGGGIYSSYGAARNAQFEIPTLAPGKPESISLFSPWNIEKNVVTIAGSSFIENHALAGGGVYMNQRDLVDPCPVCDIAASGSDSTALDAFESSGFTGNTIVGCTFTNNTAVNGGGLYADSKLTVRESTFSENSASVGGGIYHNNGTLKIQNSTISGNSATIYGGGIFSTPHDSLAVPVLWVIEAPPISPWEYGWVAEDDLLLGPGELLQADFSSQAFSTSSIADTRAANLDLIYLGSFSSLKIQNSTIVGNSAGVSGGGVYLVPPENDFYHVDYQINNSIVAGNTAPENPQLTGEFTGGFNIIQDSIDGLLDPVLRNNGGPTKTHALLQRSAAINAGSNASVEEAGIITDQRGGSYQRIFDGTVDIGAVEWKASHLVVDTLSDTDDGDYSEGQLSLREAICLANQYAGTTTIIFSEGLQGQTIYLDSELVISDTLTISGNVATPIVIDAGYGSRIFTIDDGTDALIDVSLQGLTLTHGMAGQGAAILNQENLSIADSWLTGNRAYDDGGGIYHSGGLLKVDRSKFTDNRAGENGGGIFNDARNMMISDSHFQGNTAFKYGGGIFNAQGVAYFEEIPVVPTTYYTCPPYLSLTFALPEYRVEYAFTTITGTSFVENHARSGGALYNRYDGSTNPPFFGWFWDADVLVNEHFPELAHHSSGILITDSTFLSNIATDGGGILHHDGQMTLESCTLAQNIAQVSGGAILSQRHLTILNSTIARNIASYGGGICFDSFGARLQISGSTLAQNAASISGGAIFSQENNLNLLNSTISGNHAGVSGGGIYFNDQSIPYSQSSFEFTDNATSPELPIITPDTITISQSLNPTGMLNGADFSSVRTDTYSLQVANLTILISSDLLVTNCTITGNSAGNSGGGITAEHSSAYTRILINNSIIAGNLAAESAQVDGDYTGGFNIIQSSIDGLLDPVLRDNGGPTWTHALLPGSDALNAGDNAAATAADLTTDQRGAGYERIKEGSVDIGAYEAQSPFTQIEMRFTNSRTRTSSTGEKSRLPENRTWIDQWGNHWLEIWVSTPDSTSTGIQSAEFNLNFNPEVAQAVSIEYGPAFTGNQTETIDNSAGKITGLSATTARTDVGDDQYVLLARIQFEASPATQNADDYSDSREHIVNPQFSLSQLHVQLVGGVQSEVIDATTLGTLYDRSGHDDSDAQFFTAPQYDFSQTGLYNLDWGYATRGVEFNSALDLSQLSLIVLPYTQSFLADENSDSLTQNQVDGSQTTGNASAGDRKTDISAPDGEHSLLDDYFSELNDTLELLAFET